ncbi:MAG: HAMP domain-containing protein [Desulfovibrio sp.]|jgi:two-component system nitrogen regulation sensor histidine kinase NtrY|nr:HAMP domain-containing protein [Desulfovibrio sp.]
MPSSPGFYSGQEAAPARLSPEEQRRRDRKRRQHEMLFAAAAFVVVLILTTLQLNQFRTGDRAFMVLFNVNFVLLIGILLVVLRNGFKLLLERRRSVLGSRLRTRLVLAFLALSLLPCSLMFFVTTKYVQLSMDFWFKEQIETSMETAQELAIGIYERVGMNLVAQARDIRKQAEEEGVKAGTPAMDELLEQKRRRFGNVLVGIFYLDGRTENWHAVEGLQQAWNDASDDLLKQQFVLRGYAHALVSRPTQDYIFAVQALDPARMSYLALGHGMGEGFKAGIDRVIRGSKEYRTLRNSKKPLKLMLYSSLGVLTALIILGAIWFGFRLSRELTAPILALASGTERIARGDLSVRLADSAKDEFGALIRSFNRMAQDLESSRRETTAAYTMLEEQNQQTARHSKYIETVLNNIAAGVASFDRGGAISTVNRAACEILNMEPESLLGKHIEDILPEVHGNIAKNVRMRFQKRLDTRTQHSVSLTIAGEERRLLVNVVGFSTDGVYHGAVAVFEDISELERMQRMAAWREVARRIAHEIKNPLTPIKLSAQRLARKFGKDVDNPVFIQSTELIVRQVEYLQDMVQEFSAFAKLPEVSPTPGDLSPLLTTIADLFRNSHSNIIWKLSVPDDLPQIPMDGEALHRAFMNILGNAAEALTLAKTTDPTVSIAASYQSALNLVRIDVADNGPGLSEEERSRLFEPYFSRKKGGTGLGMTIVRSIVADHRGYVRAMPRDQGGTVISMELPLA